MMLRFHTQTAGVALTAQQPLNNVARVTVQALAAVLGGTQSLHTNAMDEALGLPTERSATVALRTQQILAHESGAADVVDALAGSYAVEALTDALEEEARAIIARIDDMGGALTAVESGWMAAQIADSAYRLQREIERGERRIVGVNAHAEEAAAEPEILRIDPALGARRIDELARLRERRDADAVAAALDGVRDAARGDDNLVPPLVAAVESYATTGEICAALRAEFGEYRPPEIL